MLGTYQRIEGTVDSAGARILTLLKLAFVLDQGRTLRRAIFNCLRRNNLLRMIKPDVTTLRPYGQAIGRAFHTLHARSAAHVSIIGINDVCLVSWLEFQSCWGSGGTFFQFPQTFLQRLHVTMSSQKQTKPSRSELWDNIPTLLCNVFVNAQVMLVNILYMS